MVDIPLLYLLPIAFILGACIGSFVSMASWRMPREEEMIFTPSHCTHCNATLGARDLFPILSWSTSGGKCRHCAHPVSPRYPLIECAMGVAFTGIAYHFGISLESLVLALFVTELAILIVTDVEHYLIPDQLQLALAFTGIAWCILNDAGWDTVALGAGFGLALGLLLHFGYAALRHQEGLGLADVKFLFVAGIWIPLADFPPFLFMAGLFGIATALLWRALARGPRFPFGPALAFSLLVSVLFPGLLQRI